MDLDPRLHAYDVAKLGFLEDEEIVLDLQPFRLPKLESVAAVAPVGDK
jgi:hypothetical protein